MLLQIEEGQILAHLTKTLKPNLLNSLLRALTLCNKPGKALLVYNHMLHHSAPHDHFTYTYAVKASSLLNLNTHQKGREIHARLLKTGHHSDVFIQSSLINFYTTAGNIKSALQVFNSVRRPDVVCWTSVVSGLAKSGRGREALLAFASMDVMPNAMTLVGVLSACSRLGALRFGRSVHGYALRSLVGIDGNVILNNALLDVYMSCGSLRAARHVFDKMGSRDVVSWTTLISGFAHNGCCVEAVGIFLAMVDDGGVVPNEATLVSVLRACASLGALSLGRWVHSFVDENNIRVDGPVGNALINMYAKCGDVGMAMKVFNFLPSKDLVSWCSIMGGMALNGHGMHALQLFSLMLCNGICPDGVAFIAVLSACCHAGLVDEGIMFFEAMSEVYGIVPEKKHYACMIDMLGRAGLLKEAEELIQDMPIAPDAHVWGSLINACKIHGNNEICEQIKKSLFRGKIEVGGGACALMSNLYASACKWDNSWAVREFSRVMKIEKTVGCSWIDTHRYEYNK